MIKTGICLMILLAVFVCGDFNPASAATWTVTNTNDSGAGSLRDRIGVAAPGDTINFSVTGTITLTGQLYINKNLTIAGPGALSLTISGGGADKVFAIDSGGNVNISGLTISNGVGGIYNSGTLTLTDVVISNNGTIAGGGIASIGTLTLTNVTISGNTAGISGGGIYNAGTATLTNVTISGNTANYAGGGIYNTTAYTLTLTNVTISGNTAHGVGGGGIYNDSGTMSLRNTIVANSLLGGNCAGRSITSLGHNLDSGNTCALTGTGDLINTDPLLGPLALNAPGTTQTYALLAGSPAIDAADPGNFPPTDQRGVARPQGAGPDIGAYELIVHPVPTMNEWGMIIFIVFAGLGSVYYLRRQRRAER